MKREAELLEEIEILQQKLEHAQKWMNRQVQETPTSNKNFFDRLQKKPSFFRDFLSYFQKINITHYIHQIKKFRLFHHSYSLLEIWEKRIEAFFVWAAIILFWRGIWNLADNYLFPNHPNISAFASLLIGMCILMLTRSFVNQFLDEAVEEAD